VAVVSVDLEGERLGLTVGSFLGLSLDPPLVGVSVSRQAAMHELLRGSRYFALSLLAQHFARGVPPIALWHGVAVREGATGAPLLDAALGWIECERTAEHETGDHTLFVGEVIRLERGQARRALLRVEGGYE